MKYGTNEYAPLLDAIYGKRRAETPEPTVEMRKTVAFEQANIAFNRSISVEGFDGHPMRAPIVALVKNGCTALEARCWFEVLAESFNTRTAKLDQLEKWVAYYESGGCGFLPHETIEFDHLGNRIDYKVHYRSMVLADFNVKDLKA